MITYKLKKGGIIECTGYSSEFTLSNLKENITRSEKTIKELQANADLKETIFNNVLEHNSFIKKLTPEMIHACYMYHDAKTMNILALEKIKQFKNSIKKDKAELKEVLSQIPELVEKDAK